MESRLQTPFKDEAASVHSCDDEGKEDDGRDDMHRARNCDGAASRIARRCLWLIRQEPFCLAIAVEDGQAECIFECRANFVANGPHKRADQSQTKRT